MEDMGLGVDVNVPNLRRKLVVPVLNRVEVDSVKELFV